MSVFYIFQTSKILQISLIVVGFVAVLMVDFFSFGTRANKHGSNYLMDSELLFSAVFVKPYSRITKSAFFSKAFSATRSKRFKNAASYCIAYLSKTGDFVKSLEVWNWFPNCDTIFTGHSKSP